MSQNATCLVRAAQIEDRNDWFEMWQGYCEFYEATIPLTVSQATWSRIMSADAGVHAVLAINGSTGAAEGFANYVVHPFTWSEQSACYLEDLFVKPAARGTGVGAALIRHLIAVCRENRWARLYWMTRQNNHVAQLLYDRFATHDDFVRYVVTFDQSPPD